MLLPQIRMICSLQRFKVEPKFLTFTVHTACANSLRFFRGRSVSVGSTAIRLL
jgi:hypothetical protein